MKIIVFANHKGGVGKTTSTLSVAQTLARDGHRVLLMDCDAQRNLSLAFRLPSGYPDLGLVLEKKAQLADIVLAIEENLHLVAATPDLDFLEKMVGQQLGYESILRKGLAPLQDRYDYCLIDTPPSLSALTYMALVACNAVFIPCQPEYFGYEGLNKLIQACERVKDLYNPNLIIGGIFFTKYSSKYRKKLHHDVVALIDSKYSEAKLMMETTIRENVSLAEAQIKKQSIYRWAPESNGATDYESLTREIIARV
ncbi:chromosome partitioning protein ParA [Hymenobacter qilianensis]|uniref:ParA family protein n=2 Tax=Hymenobacter qilianensis TaxID=1385715 RepID=A0A7H0H1W3_9BACT|nr:ParA family protein [Hymenobacter qilianensis]QNP54529.1 ParA family protein [Hymenobacter qilianensis]GGF81705.1 chromosome partitioning protein ParA [Hymenobacter qilianensis]